MKRKMLVSANWKMNLTHLEAVQWVQKFHYALPRDIEKVLDVSIHPAFTALRSVQTVIDSDKLGYALGAQNCYSENNGAFTGEVSASMLAKLNCTYVIVGHSERRQTLGETDELVAKKIKSVLASGMRPILCVGETLAEREEGIERDKVIGQLRSALKKVGEERAADVVVAYEPIWAIGTGKTATAQDAQQMCQLIRSELGKIWSLGASEIVRIQYGGSMKVTNAAELTAQGDIDGGLVGGASLNPEEFASLVVEAAKAKMD